jgi:hypothetical protein
MPAARRRAAALLGILALVALGGFALGCEEGTPVSPADALLRISAQPTRIGASGTSTITVQALRGNGNPVNPGTEVRLSTTIGRIDPVAYTDDDGVARATLRGDGRVGTATVTAYSGAVEGVEVDVEVGSLAASVGLQVTPSSVPETGGTLDLLARIRDENGQPIGGVTVNFSSEVGELESGGTFVTSDAEGLARDELRVTAADLQTVGGDSFDVTVEASAQGGVVEDTFAVSIQRAPRASFTFQRVDSTVAFTDTSTGGPTSWRWSFGDGNTSTAQNPVHTYAEGGESYIVSLTVRNAVGEDTFSTVITIP